RGSGKERTLRAVAVVQSGRRERSSSEAPQRSANRGKAPRAALSLRGPMTPVKCRAKRAWVSFITAQITFEPSKAKVPKVKKWKNERGAKEPKAKEGPGPKETLIGQNRLIGAHFLGLKKKLFRVVKEASGAFGVAGNGGGADINGHRGGVAHDLFEKLKDPLGDDAI